ncbi:hypothetical protein [Anaerobaca lacustris]|uniref:Uncharacterized protein n=1 Tax=Anaerobaca lacustris TaxID=3044600 RepID=A0AAW6TWV8_9BACT|nr:hypothetical protein [Sedimentisphaerales bacterium M17dextr]
MADEERQLEVSEARAQGERRFVLGTVIADDQRQYIESVREWLRDSLEKKEKIMGKCL